MVVSDDGKRAFVSHVVGAKLTTVDLDPAAHAPRELALGSKKATVDATVGKPTGTRRLGCQGYALAKSIEIEPGGDPGVPIGEKPTIITLPKPPPVPVVSPPRPRLPPPPPPQSPIPGRLFAPFVTVDPGENGRTAYYGAVDGVPTELSQISVIDVPAERKLTNAAFGPKQRDSRTKRGARDCMLPRSAVVDGGTLFVTCLGANTLVAYDARALDPARAELHRVDVPRGPTGVAIDAEHHRAIVWSQFAHQVAVVATDSDLTAPVAVVPIVRKAAFKLSEQAAHGRDLYFGAADTNLSTEGMACASCHPDGREDAITWSTLEGPRQTPMLAGRLADTAPYAWSGAHRDLEAHLQDTVRKLRGTGLQQDDYAAIVAYLGTMKAPTVVTDHGRDALVAAGQKVFRIARDGLRHVPRWRQGVHRRQDPRRRHRHQLRRYSVAALRRWNRAVFSRWPLRDPRRRDRRAGPHHGSHPAAEPRRAARPPRVPRVALMRRTPAIVGAFALATAIGQAPAAAAPSVVAVDVPFSTIREGAYPLVPVPDAGSLLPVANLPDGFSFRESDPDRVRVAIAGPVGNAFPAIVAATGLFGGLAPATSGLTGSGRDFRFRCDRTGVRRGAIIEELSVDAAGVATLQIHQVWIDPKACSFAFVGVQKVTLQPLAMLDGAPLAYAFRKGEELTILLPPGTGLGVSAENDRLTVQRGGALERVTLPVHRGMATTIATQIADLGAWSAAAHGERSVSRVQPTAIGVDITQTSSDAAPLIVVHAKVGGQ